jgi:hypothetical protein
VSLKRASHEAFFGADGPDFRLAQAMRVSENEGFVFTVG